MNYIQRIRALREDNDLNQTKIASMLHIAQTTYSDYEKGKVRIPLEYLIELAQFYDVDLNYIAGISDIKNRFPRQMSSYFMATKKPGGCTRQPPGFFEYMCVKQ